MKRTPEITMGAMKLALDQPCRGERETQLESSGRRDPSLDTHIDVSIGESEDEEDESSCDKQGQFSP